ncbi:MAG: hypothetical protein AAGB01_12245, partial [Cyanobacteria bacterium P01_F01_bin.42]
MGRFNQAFGFIISIGMLTPLGLYAKGINERPSLEPLVQPLFQGVTYERLHRFAPRPHLIHIVTLDLKTPGL